MIRFILILIWMLLTDSEVNVEDLIDSVIDEKIPENEESEESEDSDSEKKIKEFIKKKK